jgi:hypothetical protein
MGIMYDWAHIHVFHSMSKAGFSNSSCMHAVGYASSFSRVHIGVHIIGQH